MSLSGSVSFLAPSVWSVRLKPKANVRMAFLPPPLTEEMPEKDAPTLGRQKALICLVTCNLLLHQAEGPQGRGLSRVFKKALSWGHQAKEPWAEVHEKRRRVLVAGLRVKQGNKAARHTGSSKLSAPQILLQQSEHTSGLACSQRPATVANGLPFQL